MTGYKVFTRRHDAELDAAWLVAHPEFPPFAGGRKEADEAPFRTALATREEVMQSVMDAGHDYPDLSGVSVTVLVDQSGSQRGHPREHGIVAFVDRAVEALLHVGAEVEVLGFTTLRWKGGQSREDWREAGRPPAPGRLNDVLHIVYKEFDAPWRLSVGEVSPRAAFDMVCRHPYMREGIDGEAVEWATRRLCGRTNDAKILLTVSDCAPVDDATMSVNPDRLLTDHLKAAVAAAEDAGVAVAAVSNGAARRAAPESDIYPRLLHADDYRAFDPRAAAAAVMRGVAEIAAPRSSPAP